MKLQVTNVRTGERSIVAGEDAQVEAKLRLLYPSATDRIPDGYLGNVIHAVAKVQDVGLLPLEGSLPAPVRDLPENLGKAEKPSANSRIWWHGTPSGDLRGGTTGLHVGTKLAAEEALHARIGIPAEGAWDGTREYGQTLLAGAKTLRARGIFPTGYNSGGPEEDHYPTGKATFSDGSPVLPNHKPNIIPLRIVGEMTNAPHRPHQDFRANGYMKAALKRGTARRGYYYENVGEDVGQISATLPAATHVEILSHDGVEPKIVKVEDLGKLRKMAQLDPALGYKLSHQMWPERYSDPESSEGSIGERVGFHSRTLSVTAHDAQGTPVGEAHIFVDHPKKKGSMVTGYVHVEPEHRRKGLASAMYAHAEQVTGRKLVPSKAQWDDGEALWTGNQQNPQFGKRPVKKSEPSEPTTRKLYHLTDKADFKLDPNYQPVLNRTLGGRAPHGIFLADDVERWTNGYGYWRPWVAEFEAPHDLYKLPGVSGGKGYAGNELLVPAAHFDKLKLTRVMPLDAHAREQFASYGWTEGSERGTFDGQPLAGPEHRLTPPLKPGYRFEGDVRQWPTEQRDAYAERVKNFASTRTNAIAKSEPAAMKTWTFTPEQVEEPKAYFSNVGGPWSETDEWEHEQPVSVPIEGLKSFTDDPQTRRSCGVTRHGKRGDPNYPQGRPESCDEYINAMAGAMSAGKPFPPLLLTRKTDGSLATTDGNHRLGAARLAGMTHAPAIIKRRKQDFAKSEQSPYKPEDLDDAVYYLNESSMGTGQVQDPQFLGIKHMPPAHFVDDASHLGGEAYPAGWLNEYPREQWADELRSTYSRNFEHIIDQHAKGTLAPGVQIDDDMGDGRGRAMFHHAIGAPTMPVAVFRSKMQKSEQTAPIQVWRVENEQGHGPYRAGMFLGTDLPRLPYPDEELVPGSGKRGAVTDIDERRPLPNHDFEPAHFAALQSGALKSGFPTPEHAATWFGRKGLDILQQRGFVLHPVLASQVHPSRSGRQVAFAPHEPIAKSEPTSGPMTIRFMRNTERAGNYGSTFAQDVEPHGTYMLEAPDSFDPAKAKGWEDGTVTFQNPLHMEWGGSYRDPTNWKHVLSARFGGKRGKALSQAILAAGHDAVVTHDEHGTNEIVHLAPLRKTP